MRSRVWKICLAVIFLPFMIAGFAQAQTANPAQSRNHNFESRCEDLNYTCSTSFYEDRVEVTCSYPPADWKTQPVYGNIVVTYKCQYEKQGGKGVLVCKGFLGVSPDTKATFTPEEFRDAQTRCSRLCPSCPQGWK